MKKKPCVDHFIVMPEESKLCQNRCAKCGWKILVGEYLRPVKIHKWDEPYH